MVGQKPRRAIGYLREALIADPEFVEPQLEMAKVFLHYFPDKLDVALSAISLYLKTRPESADGYYYLGQIESRRGNAEKSDEAFRKAVQLDPFDTRPLVALALRLMNRNNEIEALPLLEQAVEWYSVRPGYAESATRLEPAKAYERTGNIAGAIEQWKIVAERKEVWPEDEGTREIARMKLTEHA